MCATRICCGPIILRTVQGYFLRARQKSDAIRVIRPDRIEVLDGWDSLAMEGGVHDG
jgi:hypothetical protein